MRVRRMDRSERTWLVNRNIVSCTLRYCSPVEPDSLWYHKDESVRPLNRLEQVRMEHDVLGDLDARDCSGN